jgi:hypothetical protein
MWNEGGKLQIIPPMNPSRCLRLCLNTRAALSIHCAISVVLEQRPARVDEEIVEQTLRAFKRVKKLRLFFENPNVYDAS